MKNVNSFNGEKCTICGDQSVAKVEEDVTLRKPSWYMGSIPQYGHPMTAYVCGSCFNMIMSSTGKFKTLQEEVAKLKENEEELKSVIRALTEKLFTASTWLFSIEKCADCEGGPGCYGTDGHGNFVHTEHCGVRKTQQEANVMVKYIQNKYLK